MKKISLATLAALLAAGSMTVSTAARAQDAKAGEKKMQMCVGCHNIPGYQASFPEIYKVPKIAGQNAKYIVSALNAYKKGERKHPSMRAIATTLSDQDMADIAAYYEQLEQGRRRRRPRRPRRPPTSPSCWPRRTASPATARTSARRSTRAIPSSPASTPTTSTSPSRPTRPTTTRASAAATRS